MDSDGAIGHGTQLGNIDFVSKADLTLKMEEQDHSKSIWNSADAVRWLFGTWKKPEEPGL